jgi:hypothetical protein
MTKTNQCQIEFICHRPDLCKYFEPNKYTKDIENNCCYAANIGDLQYECECDKAIDSAMFDARMEN